MPVCLDRVHEVHGETYGVNEVWVIGDTVRDLSCARAAGVRCLLVGTGRGGNPSVRDLGADATVPDLRDTLGVLEILFAEPTDALSLHS